MFEEMRQRLTSRFNFRVEQRIFGGNFSILKILKSFKNLLKFKLFQVSSIKTFIKCFTTVISVKKKLLPNVY